MTVLCETVVGDMRDDRLADGSTCRMARQRPGGDSRCLFGWEHRLCCDPASAVATGQRHASATGEN